MSFGDLVDHLRHVHADDAVSVDEPCEFVDGLAGNEGHLLLLACLLRAEVPVPLPHVRPCCVVSSPLGTRMSSGSAPLGLPRPPPSHSSGCNTTSSSLISMLLYSHSSSS